MTSIHEIFTTFGPEYLQRYADDACPAPIAKSSMPSWLVVPRPAASRSTSAMAAPSRNSSFALAAIAIALPASTLKLSSGSKNRSSANSRAITSCITFTVPEQLRSFMRQHQRVGYSALFKASSDAIKKLATRSKAHRW